MAVITLWSIQSPNAQAWQPSIDAHGTVTFAPVGSVLTATPPVYADELAPSVVHTPSISNAGIVTLTSGADTGQLRAALVDPNGAQHLGVVSAGIAFFRAPKLHVGDLFTFGLFDQESVPLLVKSIQPGPDLTARITLVDAAPGVHQASTGVIPPFESHITLPRVGQDPVPQPKIDRIASDETVMLRSTDGSLVPRIVVSLHLPSGAAAQAEHLEEQHRLAGSSSAWERQLFSASSIAELSIVTVQEGLNYDLRFRSIGSAGQTSPWTTVETYAVIGKTSPPPDVTGLSVNGQQLVWLYPDAPPDLAGFRVRMHTDERTSWGDAAPLHDGLVSQTSFLLYPEYGKKTYLVKAVDTSLNESLNVGALVIDYGALATRNVAEFLDLRAEGFPGAIANGSVLAGNLVANSDTIFWKSDGNAFWSESAALMWPGTFSSMQYLFTVTPPSPWLGGLLLIDAAVQSAGWRIDYAHDGPAKFWGDPSASFWTADASLFWLSSQTPVVPFWPSQYLASLSNPNLTFQPWPGRLTGYTRQPYSFMITTAGGRIQGLIQQLRVIFDMPDLEEKVLNVAIAAPVDGDIDTGAGAVLPTRLTLSKPFAVIQVVAPSVVEDGSGAVRIRVMDKELIGPAVIALDQQGSPVAGHGDFLIKGY